MHLWYSVLGKAVVTASCIPLKPSAQRIIISLTPRFLRSLRTPSQYLALFIFSYTQTDYFLKALAVDPEHDICRKFTNHAIVSDGEVAWFNKDNRINAV